MSEVGVEIVKTEEAEKSGIKYLNINVSNSEVERNPDIVRLCADAGILEYVKPSGDAISRQAVLDVIEELKKIHFDRVVVLNKVRDRVLDLLPVTPQEPKTGHWKRRSIDFYIQHVTGYYKCSECGEDVVCKHNYCPNCGCRMVEPQESEE